MATKSLWEDHPIFSSYSRKKPSRFSLWETFHFPLIGLLIGFLLIGLLNQVFFRLYKLNGESNTLFPQSNYVLAEVASYLFRYPQLKEVVVFQAQGKHYVGQIVEGSVAQGFTLSGTQQETWQIKAEDISARVYYPRPRPPRVLSSTSAITPPPTTIPPSVTPPILTPTPKTSPVPVQSRWYLLSLRPQSEPVKLTGSLASFITQQLIPKVENPFTIQSIVYDSALGSPFDNEGLDRLNFDYFLKISGEALSPVSLETGDITFSLSPADPALTPYLEDQKYCQVSADCAQRQRYCEIASFNRFQPYLDVWACRWYEDQEGQQTRWYDADRHCTQVVEYQRHECSNHQCVGGQKTSFCQSVQ